MSNSTTTVSVTISRDQVMQAIRDLINNNEDFDHRIWALWHAETMENAAKYIRQGYEEAKGEIRR